MIVEQGQKAMIDRFYNETPTHGRPKLFSVGINQTNPQFTDTELTNEVEFDTGITEKEFSIGYPTIDFNTYSAKYRLFINSLEANDNELNGVAIKDENGVVYSINRFEPQPKTSAVEISIIKTERIQE